MIGAGRGSASRAPLTSTNYLGEHQAPDPNDYRPEVYDSDGMALQTGAGEWLWRPLVNPPALQVSSFGVTNSRGFGLMQRDRAYAHYEDLEARYELRPSVCSRRLGLRSPRRRQAGGTARLPEAWQGNGVRDLELSAACA